jgi:hypothetical protein
MMSLGDAIEAPSLRSLNCLSQSSTGTDDSLALSGSAARHAPELQPAIHRNLRRPVSRDLETPPRATSIT